MTAVLPTTTRLFRRTAALVSILFALNGTPSESARVRGESAHIKTESARGGAKKDAPCPRGLEPRDVGGHGHGHGHGDEHLCAYTQPVPEPRPSRFVPEMKWANASTAPIYFHADGGISLERQFIAELTAAASSPLGRAVLTDILGLDQHNGSIHHHKATTNALHTIDGHTNETTWEDKLAEAQHTLHGLEQNLRPAFTITEHVGQHVVLEGVLEGFEVLAHAAEGGAFVGGEAVVGVLDASVVGLHIFGEALASPFFLAPTAAYVAWQMHEHYRAKREHSIRFSTSLAVKSRCMTEKSGLLLSTAEELLRPQVADICGVKVAKLVSEQAVRTNGAMMELFERNEELGRCLFPAGDRSWSKTNCGEALFETLHGQHGHNGVLFSSLAMIETYGREADQFFARPIYNKWFELEFGHLTPAPNVSNATYLAFAKIADEDIEARSVACLSLLASHRAYERVFMRLKVALGVYMQTFARNIVQASLRTSWHPCRRVVFDMGEGHDNGDGFCKELNPLGDGEGDATMWDAMHVHVGANSTVCFEGETVVNALWPAAQGHGEAGGHGGSEDHGQAGHDAFTPAHAKATATTTEPPALLCCSCPVSIGYQDNRAECEAQCVDGRTTCNNAEAAYCVSVPCHADGAVADAPQPPKDSNQELQDEVASIAADVAHVDEAEEEQLELVHELATASNELRDVTIEGQGGAAH